MKGGLAVILSLLDDPAIGTGWARVGAIFYAGEEGPAEGNDLRRLLEGSGAWARDADLVIVCEPTACAIEVGCVGVVNAEVAYRGVACHSARPWLGRSALDKALPFLERVAAFAPREHDVAGFVFRETAVVTVLRAGDVRNVVPGDLQANLNYRFPPGWDEGRARAAVAALTGDADEVRIRDFAPSGTIPIERPLFATFLRGSGRPARAKQGWTDVARFGALGTPALNFGPGDPGLCHCDDERIDVGSLEECRATLESFLSGEGPFRRKGDD
jgi:succinyl-diaminopimelate desuccinylase